MAVQTTPNLGLTLPYQTDPVAVSTQNGNLALIDTAVGALPSGQTIQGQIDALNSNINTTYRDIYGNGSINDCNNAEIGKWYHIYPSASNVPIQNTGILFTYGNSGDMHQICESASRYFVRRYNGSAWTNWEELALNSNMIKVMRDSIACTTSVSIGGFSYRSSRMAYSGKKILAVMPRAYEGGCFIASGDYRYDNSFYLFGTYSETITCDIMYIDV